ncbi:unnamed protein product [Medioppia subpectinata]|uniref:Carboxylic ester hydrolase n=1 Tax=Medioppia subpectinata TaxID=1979941 RepID=A0A7R9KGT8_9ACAR|nr:unnamed protein product [Medioppia subpectinata]CAG2103294.1 unnamed protein product [Medioppia subpectinata]
MKILDCVEVHTTSGTVKGLTVRALNTNINQFLNIPYAEPPVGKLRFAKPSSFKGHVNGTIDGTKPGHSCYQTPNNPNLKQSEDCLVLNIWAPKAAQNNSEPKAVMLWLYGGGLNGGTIFGHYNGSYLSAHDVVIVTVNYRLGKYGFLYGGVESAPGNVGLYDQVEALKWVRENIGAFGGDKFKITVFGESAGSRSISALIVSPVATGLFQRVIMESGANLHFNARQQHTIAESMAESTHIAKTLNCSISGAGNADHWLDCLRKVAAKEFQRFGSQFTFPLEFTEFLPLSIQHAFSQSKYNQNLDILAGVNRNEGSSLAYGGFAELHHNITDQIFDQLVTRTNNSYHGLDLQSIRRHYLKDNDNKNHTSDELRKGFYDFFGDLHVKCCTYLMAKEYAKHQDKNKHHVYMYELTYQSKWARQTGCDEKTMGICHGSDVEFVWGLPLWMDPKTHTQLDIDFSKYVMRLWTNFAKTGKADEEWPQLVDNNVIHIKDLNPLNTTRVLVNPFHSDCDTIESNI